MALLKIKVREGATKTLKGLQRWAQMELPRLTFEQAEDGKRFAVARAPRKTNALVNSIAVATQQGKGYAVVSRMPQGQKRNTPRPYHLFMHGIKASGFKHYDIGGQIRSGSPRYMELTYFDLAKKYPEMITKSLDKQIKK